MMGYSLVGTIVVILCIGIGINYQIVRRHNNVEQIFKRMEFYVIKQFDLIPSLVTVINRCGNYEKEALIKIIELKSKYERVFDRNERISIGIELSFLMAEINKDIENYSIIKRDEQFIYFQYNFSIVEKKLFIDRKAYDVAVVRYNNKLEKFPGVVIANLRGSKSKGLLIKLEKKDQGVTVDKLFS